MIQANVSRALCAILVLIPMSVVHAQIPQIERDALIAFYNSTDGPNWTNSDNWLDGVGTECTWNGVGCYDGHVQSLFLDSNQLNGPLPPELGNLTSVTVLYLSFNQLSGDIPSALGNLENLQDLRLYSNELSGSIPSQLGGLANLSVLILGVNQLNGEIPFQLGSLPSLTILSMGTNQLSGSIPPELGDLASLQLLYLNDNQLSGSIPPQLGDLPSVTSLDLARNQLGGSIPAQLGNLPSVTILFLNSNQLVGSIPPQLGDLSTLTNLRLGANHLSGSIPPQLSSLSSLSSLLLNSNRLSGSIPPQLGTLSTLGDLRLDANQLIGEIPVELADLAGLGSNGLDIRWNALHTDDAGLIAFLDDRQSGGDWQSTQTVAPENLVVEWVGDHTAWLSWDAVGYQAAPGGYEAFFAASAGGSWVSAGRTAAKTEIEMPVPALDPGVSYDLAVASFTVAHIFNQNNVTSDLGPSQMAMTATLGCSAPVIDVDWGNPTTLSVSGAFDSYLWSTGETTSTIDVDPTQPRFHWVTVTSSGPCQESAIVLVDPQIFGDDFESGNTSAW